MIAGSDYVQVTSVKDVVVLTVRQNGVTVCAYLRLPKALDLENAINGHVNAAESWRAPVLIEYTGEAP